MKDEKLHTVDWELVRKKIDGMLNEEEHVRLERWMDASGEHRKFVERACQYYRWVL